MRINNFNNLYVHNIYKTNNKNLSNNSNKLSSGLRVLSAADDAAGLAISKKMLSQIRGLNMASRNLQDSVSRIQVVTGALSETNNMLNRFRELSIQKMNDTYTGSDKKLIEKEQKEILKEINRVTTQTEFNRKNAFGEFQSTSGPNGELVAVAGANFEKLNRLIKKGPGADLSEVDEALSEVSGLMGVYGGYSNKFEHSIRNLEFTSENTLASNSRIRDIDMAKGVMEQTRYNILSQFQISLMMQANQNSRNVLDLIK